MIEPLKAVVVLEDLRRPEPVMSIPRSVAEVIGKHVTLEVEGIDRMYLNVYQPKLQAPKQAAWFFRFHRGQPVASSVPMGIMSNAFLAQIDGFVEKHNIPVVHFRKGQRKDDVAAEHRACFQGTEGILFLGKAQEKASVFRTEKRTDAAGKKYPWIVKSTAMVNQLYFYCIDEDFGPFFLKFSTYFPYNAKLCINGHEYVKRQLAKEGIAFEPLDNGILSCVDPKRLQEICDSLSAAKINALLRKWLAKLPHPYTAVDRQAGHRYDISILQAEFSLTQVLDRPQTGRIFFEEVIRENLDLGRPDQVQLIFQRRVKKDTPGRFRTRVLTAGVVPSLHVDYKTTKIKQYHKEGRGLRTETTINNPCDFNIGKRLHNLPALRKIGFQANRRLLDVQQISHDCTIGEEAFRRVNEPVVMDGQRASALRFADPQVLALFNALLVFRLLPRGFSNRELRDHWAPLVGKTSQSITPGQMTYHLRRLRLHGLIQRLPKSHRYRVTDQGWRTILFCTRCHNRLLRPGLTQVLLEQPAPGTKLRRRFDQLDQAIEQWLKDQKFAV
jgi:DNA-binding PadR family transcriptional regulator